MRGIEGAIATDRSRRYPSSFVLRLTIPFKKLMTKSSTTVINALQRSDKLLILLSFNYPFQTFNGYNI
jgi:hypothetical protein